jgi:hypothetical protein
MPGKGFKSLTVKDTVYDKLNLDTRTVENSLNKILEEKEILQRFASKIKKYPETVRVYTNPFMEKKNED